MQHLSSFVHFFTTGISPYKLRQLFATSYVLESLLFQHFLDDIPDIKEVGDEEPYYSTKISIFSFIWAGLAALHKLV